MQFTKSAVFATKLLTAPRASLGAFRSQPLATGAGVKSRQGAKLASTALTFIARERNASVEATAIKAGSEAYLEWETAYQKAKVEHPDSPESWTQIADKAGNESIKRNVDEGDAITNVLFGDDDTAEKIGVSLTKLKARKAGEVQKGRVDARRRDFAKALRLNMERTKTELAAIGADVANVADPSATSVASIRKSANDSYDVFRNSIMKDPLIRSAEKTAALTNYINNLTSTFIDHMIATDPANAARHIELVNSIANNGAYRKHIDPVSFEQQEKRILSAAQRQNTLVKMDLDQRFTKDLNSRQIMLNNITKSMTSGDVQGAMSALSKLEEQTRALKEKTYIDPQGNRVLMWKGEHAKNLEAAYDDAALIVMGPMYSKLISALTIRVGDEGVDPKTHDNAEKFLHLMRTEDPDGFFRLLGTLSPAKQDIARGELQKITDKEKSSAGAQLRHQKDLDLVATTKVSVANVVNQAQLLVASSRFNSLTPSKKAIELQAFLEKHWRDDIMTNARARGEHTRSGPEINAMLLPFKNQIATALGLALKESPMVLNLYDVAKGGSAKDFQLLFGFLADAGLGGLVAASHARKLSAHKARLTSDSISHTAMIKDRLARGAPISEDFLKKGQAIIVNLARLNGSGPEVFEAIDINYRSLAVLAERARVGTQALDDALSAGSDPAKIAKRLVEIRGGLSNVLSTLDASGDKSGVTADIDGQQIEFVRLSVDTAQAMYGPDGGGMLGKIVIPALRQRVKDLNIQISALDRGTVFDLNNSSKLPDLFGLNTANHEGVTPLQGFFDDPGSSIGQAVTQKIIAMPALAAHIAPRLKQMLSAAFISGEGTDQNARAKVLWELSAIISDAGKRLTHKFGDDSVPEAVMDIMGGYASAQRNVDVSQADYSGRLLKMQTFVAEPKGDGSKDIDIDGSWISDGHYSKEELLDVVADNLNLISNSKYYFSNESVFPDSNGYEKTAVLAELRKIKPPIGQKHPKYLKYLATQVEKISNSLQLDGIIGVTAVGVGAVSEFSPTFAVVPFPIERSFSSKRALEFEKVWGDDDRHVKGILANINIIGGFLASARERGLSIDQIRASITRRDINGIMSRYIFGGENSKIRTGESKLYGETFQKVSAPHKQLVGMLDAWAAKHYGVKTFFPDEFSADELRSGAGGGIFASRETTVSSLGLFPVVSAISRGMPGPNSITVMPTRLGGSVGESKKVAGSDGIPRRVYDLMITVPRAKTPISIGDIPGAVEKAFVTKQEPPTTITIRQLSLPSINGKSGSFSSNYFNWFDQYTRDAYALEHPRGAQMPPPRGPVPSPAGPPPPSRPRPNDPFVVPE